MRTGFAPFASKNITLTGSDFAPSDLWKQQTGLLPPIGLYGNKRPTCVCSEFGQLLVAVNSDLAAQGAMDRLAKVGFDGLSEPERVWAAVWLFEAGVGNQGFIGYYSSAKGDLAFFVPTALRLISAHELAAIADQANAVFGPEGPPRDREARRQQIHALPAMARELLSSLERRYFDCEEDVDTLLGAYRPRNPQTY